MPQHIDQFYEWQIDDAGNVVEINQSADGAMNAFSPDFSLADQDADTQVSRQPNISPPAAIP